jgi:hypothetical protein
VLSERRQQLSDRSMPGAPPDRERDDRRGGERSGRPALVRIADRGRWPLVLTALIAVFLIGAMLKPWASAPRHQALVQAPTPQPTAVSPSVEPDPLAGLRAQCEEPAGWRVYSRGGFLDLAVRVWRSVVPATVAIGPLDPAVPLIQVGPVNKAVGYCAPWTGTERPPDVSLVSAWRLGRDAGGSTAVPVALVRVAPDRASVLGALYAGPADRSGPVGGPDAGWPDGRYVFAVRAPTWERWWAIDVLAPGPGPRPSPGPGSSPGAGGSPDPYASSDPYASPDQTVSTIPAQRPASP